MMCHLEPDILEFEVKCVLGSITMNKASGSDEIPVELFQILKDNAVRMQHSVWQQIWKAPKKFGKTVLENCAMTTKLENVSFH